MAKMVSYAAPHDSIRVVLKGSDREAELASVKRRHAMLCNPSEHLSPRSGSIQLEGVEIEVGEDGVDVTIRSWYDSGHLWGEDTLTFADLFEQLHMTPDEVRAIADRMSE
ncbi:MAG: hypothetical protein IMZ50_08870 [Candidatus Atribacteria bacterium]|nr:hypothetical protein [Candidatus Atribacteria bacterium]